MICPKLKTIALFTIGVLSIAIPGLITATSSAIVVNDLDGRQHTFFSETNASRKPFVFIFVLSDCPISNSYTAEFKRLRSAFPEIEFFRVYADSDITVSEARQHSRDYDCGFSGLLDPAQQLVAKSGVTRTPEAAVFSPIGKLLYRGRIDDRYVDFGKKRDSPGQRDLENALVSILNKKPVQWPDKPPIGCFIPTTKNPHL